MRPVVGLYRRYANVDTELLKYLTFDGQKTGAMDTSAIFANWHGKSAFEFTGYDTQASQWIQRQLQEKYEGSEHPDLVKVSLMLTEKAFELDGQSN